MSIQYIQLKNPSGDLLYPRTDWRAILDKPSIASAEELALKQDKLTSANSGPGITIETVEDGIIRISAINSTNYSVLTNQPQINGITLSGNISLGDLGINYNQSTENGAWEIADEAGDVALRITNEGHLITKSFNSEDIPTHVSQLINDSAFLTQSMLDSALTAYKVNVLDSVYLASSDFISALTNALIKEDQLPRFGVSQFSNDLGYLTPATVYSWFRAGAGIVLSRSGNVTTITATNQGSGSSIVDYRNLIFKPSINGITLAPNQTYGDLKLPYVSSTTLGAFEVSDDVGNIALRITNTGHLETKQFNSGNIQGTDIKSTNIPRGYVLTSDGNGSAYWAAPGA